MDLNDLVYIDATGYHYADYPSFLAWRQNQFRTIYGADIYIEPDSQDGQWLAVLAQSDYDTAVKGAATYNSFPPSSAQGVGLSRVVKINGIKRMIPSLSSVDLVVVGTAGTVIQNGVAEDNLNQKWNLPILVTIPGPGTITVTATAQDPGATQAQPNTVTTIFTPTRGWQTVNNPNAAAPGSPVESDAELRIRQSQSVANPSLTVMDGTVGAVQSVEGVTQCRGYENDTNSTDLNGIPAHSICIVAEGGDAVAIAQAIALHKTPGTGTYGMTSELVYDAHGMPLLIKFQRPDLVPITVSITGGANDAWSADYITLIKQSVADYINSIGIGNDVLFTKLFQPAYLNGNPIGNSYDIATLEIARDSDPPAASNIDIAFDELPTCDVDDISVVIS